MLLSKKGTKMRLRQISLSILLSRLISLPFIGMSADYAWIEAEKPSSIPKILASESNPEDKGFGMKDWGNPQIMSEGKVLDVSISEKENARRLGRDGAVFSYDFNVDSKCRYQVWGRIGYEWVRTDFDWSIDGGEWKTLKASEPTCDLVPVSTWKELAWVKFGEAELGPGEHALKIRLMPLTVYEYPEEKAVRTLNMFDCFCISKENFVPNGKFRPDENYLTDKDKKAAENVFTLKAAARPGERSSVDLGGLWQIARWDEQNVKEDTRLKGTEALPENLDSLIWYGITVPGEKDKERPDFQMCHRFIVRTKVVIPETLKNHSFILDFDSFAMIASVFVNGRLAGWSKDCFASWQCDLTNQVLPGKENDIAIVFKDSYYGISDLQKGARYYFNVPKDVFNTQAISMKLDMPVWNGNMSGIIAPLKLVAAGIPYVSDVFAKPSVKNKSLGLDVSVFNPSLKPVTIAIENEIIPWSKDAKAGKAEKTFASQKITVQAGKDETITVSEKWETPKLWWPDEPNLYLVVTKLVVDGETVDSLNTRFGFREWEWDSHLFKLNGVKWQIWADCTGEACKSLEEQKKWCGKTGINMTRLWTFNKQTGAFRKEVLNFWDENGLPVRSSGIFDGEMASYGLVEKGDPKRALFDNWFSQMRAWIKTERNHPSIFIWSIENEVTFINSCNLGTLDIVEPEIRKGAEIVEQMDPTRPSMVDGGRALKKKTMPVNGCHYNDMAAGLSWRDYPDMAYNSRDFWYKTCNRSPGVWPMAQNKPMFHGECYYANGMAPAEYSALDGDRCFIGRAEAQHAKGLYGKILTEGWRWDEVSAWHMWIGYESDLYYNSMKPVCVFCRQWNWTFATDSEVKRTLKVFNSTRHNDPIDVKCELRMEGKTLDSFSKTFNVPAGGAQEFDMTLKIPHVEKRTHAEFVMTCSINGKEVFKEIKNVSVINPGLGVKPDIKKDDLAVYDPAGTVKKRLSDCNIPFTEISSLDAIPSAKNLILGRNSIPADKASNDFLSKLAAAGSKILVLEQDTPLCQKALPADLEPSDFTGRIAFAEDLLHPVMDGLEQCDFFTWSGDGSLVYRKAYKKASYGAKSLMQCDTLLNYSALAECQTGDGLLLLSQLAVGEKLDKDPVAQKLFDNMLNYIASYKPIRKATSVFIQDNLKFKLINNSGLNFSSPADILSALDPKYGVTIIEASPENLKKLAESMDKVKAFTEKGGWIMLWGLTPEGLASFNKIVGFEHIIRPFHMEKVVFSNPRDSLCSGITLRDIVMDSGKEIFSFLSLKFPAEDEFSYIVDYDEVAPFMKLPTPEELGKPKDSEQLKGWDHWPQNLVNGYSSDDTWRFTYSFLLDRGDKTRWTMELPREEEFTSFSIIINNIYHKISRINIYFDDNPKPVTLAVEANHERQDFSLEGRKGRKITMEIADWDKSGTQNVIGIDNFWFNVKRSDAFLSNIKALLNIGGLVRYNIGKGGILLNQLNVLEREVNPINADKKATVVKSLLKNMGADFGGAQKDDQFDYYDTVSYRYFPVKFEDGKFNAYMKKTGNDFPWFSNYPGDLSALPAGENRFDGVTYSIQDFRTSPVPSCIILKGLGSKTKDTRIDGIKIGMKCDALYFLQTFNASEELLKITDSKDAPLLFKYVVHYADGTKTEIPVKWLGGTGDWHTQAPKSCTDASIAWSAEIPDDKDKAKTVIYSMKWINPTPEKLIEAVDFTQTQDKDKWGAPALLAITAGTIIK